MLVKQRTIIRRSLSVIFGQKEFLENMVVCCYQQGVFVFLYLEVFFRFKITLKLEVVESLDQWNVKSISKKLFEFDHRQLFLFCFKADLADQIWEGVHQAD